MEQYTITVVIGGLPVNLTYSARDRADANEKSRKIRALWRERGRRDLKRGLFTGLPDAEISETAA